MLIRKDNYITTINKLNQLYVDLDYVNKYSKEDIKYDLLIFINSILTFIVFLGVLRISFLLSELILKPFIKENSLDLLSILGSIFITSIIVNIILFIVDFLSNLDKDNNILWLKGIIIVIITIMVPTIEILIVSAIVFAVIFLVLCFFYLRLKRFKRKSVEIKKEIQDVYKNGLCSKKKEVEADDVCRINNQSFGRIFSSILDQKIKFDEIEYYFFTFSNKEKQYYSNMLEQIETSFGLDNKDFEILLNINNHNNTIEVLVFTKNKINIECYKKLYQLIENRVYYDLRKIQKIRESRSISEYVLRDITNINNKINLLLRESNLKSKIDDVNVIKEEKIKKRKKI